MKQLKCYYTPFITTLFLLLFGHGVWGQVNITPIHTGTITSFPSWTHTSCTQANASSNDYVKMVSANSKITSPIFDFSNYNLKKLNFKAGSFGTVTDPKKTITVSISINNGTNWTVLGTRIPSSSAIVSVSEFDIDTYSGTQILLKIETLGADGSNGVRLDDISITGVLNNTIYTTSWSNNSPTSSIDAIIDGDLIASSDLTCKNLTINAGKSLTITSGTRLTVNGNIVNNGTLTLESGATLVQGTGNTASGTGVYNVQQALTGAGGATPSGRFWYMGSPLSGASSTAFDAAGDNRLWTYAEATQSYTEITTNGVAMSPIQGHVARLGASSTVNFTGGAINSGSFTNNSLTNTGTGSTRGYTLISNPYPSFLDWDLISAGATGIATSLWFRTNDGSSMVYDTYNATGGVSTLNSGVTTNPRYIPPMQAFWVYNPTDGTTGSLTISNSMRSHQSNGGLKDATDFPAFVRLNLENDAAIDQTVLYFDNNAAAGYDNFDSDKMLVPNTAQVYTFVGNKKLAINGMKSVKANKQVPLTVEFPTAKAYAFNATEVAMTDGIVLLEDRLKKVFQDLTMNPVYEFVADAGTTSDRFVVHFQPNGGVAGIESAEENGIAIVSNAAGLVTITLSEELPATGTIHIIDINGKVIATQAINEQTTTMNINAATGVYHVLVDSASKVARKKIVITK